MKLFNIICALGAVFLLWCAFSFCDIIADNNKPDPVHSDYNIFVLINSINE